MSPVTFGGKENPMQSITVTGVVMVPIEVSSEVPKEFIIEVNGMEFETIKVGAHSKVKTIVPVRLNHPNVVENHKICSIGQGLTLKTKICTKVKAYWLQERL